MPFPEPPAPEANCTECNGPLRGNPDRCPTCGKALAARSDPPAERELALLRNAARPQWIWVRNLVALVVMVALVAVGVGAYHDASEDLMGLPSRLAGTVRWLMA